MNGRAILNLLEGSSHDVIVENLNKIWNISNRQNPSIENEEVRSLLTDQKAPLYTIWDEKNEKRLNGVGPVRMSKLMARKLPHLVPIYDSVLASAFNKAEPAKSWRQRHWSTTADLFAQQAFVNHLKDLKQGADLPQSISLLRIMDVAIWMEEKNRDGKW